MWAQIWMHWICAEQSSCSKQCQNPGHQAVSAQCLPWAPVRAVAALELGTNGSLHWLRGWCFWKAMCGLGETAVTQGRSERECLCQCLVLLLRVFLFACKQMLSLCLHILLGELIQCLCGGSKGLRTLTWEWRLQHLLEVSVPNGLLIPKIAGLGEHKMRCSWNRSSTVASESYNLHVFSRNLHLLGYFSWACRFQ